MQRIKLAMSLAVSAALVALLGATGAGAEMVNMRTDLSGRNQGPPIDAKGSGAADLVYDTATRKLTWTITYKDLTGTPSAGHLHGPAEPAQYGGVVIAFDDIEKSPIRGSGTLTEQQAADMLAGRYYVNVHTAANPTGEVRGQLARVAAAAPRAPGMATSTPPARAAAATPARPAAPVAQAAATTAKPAAKRMRGPSKRDLEEMAKTRMLNEQQLRR